MMQCNVIKSFEEVVSTRYDSEEEIDAAINSYSAVGGRLANQNERTFSDVDIAGYKSRQYLYTRHLATSIKCKKGKVCKIF